MAEYGKPSAQPAPTPAPTPHDLYLEAKSCTSLPGELCKFSGALGAAVGALLTVASIGSGNGAAFLVTGTATVALAMAGAPIAAIGSMATNTKRQTKFAELDAWLKKEGY